MNEWNSIIRHARESKRLKSKEVAEIVGITPIYYCRLEKGASHRPGKQLLAKICETLDLDFQKMAEMVGYSKKVIDQTIKNSLNAENLVKIVYDLGRLSNQDFELVADIVKQFPNLTRREKEIIKFIVSKDNASG